MTTSKAEAQKLLGLLKASAVAPETPEEFEAAEARALDIQRCCKAADPLSDSDKQALENRLLREARRLGLRVVTLADDDAHRHGIYQYRLLNGDTGRFVGTGEDQRGLELGEVQFLVERGITDEEWR